MVFVFFVSSFNPAPPRSPPNDGKISGLGKNEKITPVLVIAWLSNPFSTSNQVWYSTVAKQITVSAASMTFLRSLI